MIIIETTIIFCCRLGSLLSLIEKFLLIQDFKSNIDIDATTNEDDYSIGGKWRVVLAFTWLGSMLTLTIKGFSIGAFLDDFAKIAKSDH